jgi:hypothetical protein
VAHCPLLREGVVQECGRFWVIGAGPGQYRRYAADVSPFGPSDEGGSLRRIAPYDGGDWIYITDPAEGLPIRSTDLLVPGQDVQRYEDERDLLRRSASTAGAAPRYDWDAMYAWLFKRINDDGLPESQATLVGPHHEQAAGVGGRGWPHCPRPRAAAIPSDAHSAGWSASGCGPASADDLERGAAADQQRGEGVAQVMDAHIRQVGLALDPDPEAADFRTGLPMASPGKSHGLPRGTTSWRWRTMATTSCEIGTRWILRCLVVAAGFDQIA